MSVRDQLVTGTAELIRRHGVAGTGITEIIRTTGVARRSVYLNFPGGKAELVAAAARQVGDLISARVVELAESDPNPVHSFVELYKELLVEADFDGGCVVAAVAASRRDAPDAAEVASSVFGTWETTLADRFRRDGVETQRADGLATTVVAAIEGAILLCRAHRSTEPLDRVAALMTDLLGR